MRKIKKALEDAVKNPLFLGSTALALVAAAMSVGCGYASYHAFVKEANNIGGIVGTVFSAASGVCSAGYATIVYRIIKEGY